MNLPTQEWGAFLLGHWLLSAGGAFGIGTCPFKRHALLFGNGDSHCQINRNRKSSSSITSDACYISCLILELLLLGLLFCLSTGVQCHVWSSTKKSGECNTSSVLGAAKVLCETLVPLFLNNFYCLIFLSIFLTFETPFFFEQ